MAISSTDIWAPGPGGGPGGDDRVALAVVDPDPKLRTRLALQLGADADVVTYSEVAALAEYQLPGRPLVVVFGPGLADDQGLADIERFTRARPDAGAILVAAELSTSLLQQALRSGVRDVLGAPTEATSLSSPWSGWRRH